MHGNGNNWDPMGPWDSRVNGSDNDYVIGMGIKVWDRNRAMGMGMNFHCSFSTYHNEILFSST